MLIKILTAHCTIKNCKSTKLFFVIFLRQKLNEIEPNKRKMADHMLYPNQFVT